MTSTAIRPDVTLTASERSGLRACALAAVAGLIDDHEAAAPEVTWLLDHVASALGSRGWHALWQQSLGQPSRDDAPLCLLRERLHLDDVQTLVVALCAAVEEHALVGRALARLQSPVGGSRPTVGLLSAAFDPLRLSSRSTAELLATGAATGCGVLLMTGEEQPLPDRALRLPMHVALALRGSDAVPPGAVWDPASDVRLGERAMREAKAHARALDSDEARVLVVRSSSRSEGIAAARAIADALQRRAALLDAERLTSVAPWLLLRNALPVLAFNLGPGERCKLPSLPGYDGPTLVLLGPDGGVDLPLGSAAQWRLEVPARAEREVLWLHATGDADLAREMARHHRHGAGRIAQLSGAARHVASIQARAQYTREDLAEASWLGEVGGLESLAEPVRDRVRDDALVMTPALRNEVETLFHRCQMRDELTAGLGASVAARYRPGVRALFVGPSGTGKTMAAAWLATQLGLPLFRVDLASVTSKYIGETEKNLAQLLARAEHAEVVLLFDEADEMFGKRTDVKDANDRFANAQTNYLLQRIESYDGIVLLTSNSRNRFDAAFTRRLDSVVEFPLPGPEERRALWRSHLGEQTSLTPLQLNQLSATADFSGGHIRNAVLAAAALARVKERPIGFDEVLAGTIAEYRKLGRQLPSGLSITD